MKGSMKEIRRKYGVPAKRGMKVIFFHFPATIKSAKGEYLMILKDGFKRTVKVHPTWEMTYLVKEEQK